LNKNNALLGRRRTSKYWEFLGTGKDLRDIRKINYLRITKKEHQTKRERFIF